MRRIRPLWALMAPELLAAACAVGPNYHRPDVHAQAQFIAAGTPAARSRAVTVRQATLVTEAQPMRTG